MKTFNYSDNKGEQVKITTLDRGIERGKLLGLCEDGIILIDIDTPLGAVLCEINSKDMIEIELISLNV